MNCQLFMNTKKKQCINLHISQFFEKKFTSVWNSLPINHTRYFVAINVKKLMESESNKVFNKLSIKWESLCNRKNN